MTVERLSRRTLLASGLAAALPLTGCAGSSSPSETPSTVGLASQPGTGTTSSAAQSSAAQSGAAQSSAAQTPASSGSALRTGTGPPAGPDVTHGPRTGSSVALTFHGAGDAGILRRMLAILAAGGAHVTVLAIGQWLAAEPAMAKQILDGGHDLGNHTWSHQTMPRLSAARDRTEIDRAAAELRTLTGSTGRWFRPSGTPRSTPAIRTAAGAAGYAACLAYDVDPLDYTDPGAVAIARNVASAVRPGSIVSLHLGHPGTLEAMPVILDTLRSRGLHAVTATTLLGVR